MCVSKKWLCVKALGSPQLRATCRHKLANCSALPHEIGHICFSGEAGKETVLPLPNLLLILFHFCFLYCEKNNTPQTPLLSFILMLSCFSTAEGEFISCKGKMARECWAQGGMKVGKLSLNILHKTFWKSVWNSSCAEEHWELKMEDVFYSKKKFNFTTGLTLFQNVSYVFSNACRAFVCFYSCFSE